MMEDQETADDGAHLGQGNRVPRGFFAMGTLSDLVVRQEDAPPRRTSGNGRLHMSDFRGRTIPRPQDDEDTEA